MELGRNKGTAASRPPLGRAPSCVRVGRSGLGGPGRVRPESPGFWQAVLTCPGAALSSSSASVPSPSSQRQRAPRGQVPARKAAARTPRDPGLARLGLNADKDPRRVGCPLCAPHGRAAARAGSAGPGPSRRHLPPRPRPPRASPPATAAVRAPLHFRSRFRPRCAPRRRPRPQAEAPPPLKGAADPEGPRRKQLWVLASPLPSAATHVKPPPDLQMDDRSPSLRPSAL